METITDDRKAVHLPDLSFAQFCQQTYGLNRGVYNTLDAWFYKMGVTDIAARRERIIHFLDHAVGPAEEGNLKFGHGGLSPRLTAYWERYLSFDC